MNKRTEQLLGNSEETTRRTRSASRERRGKKPHIEYTKVCPICGEKFQARTQKAVVCSDRCQYQLKKMRAAQSELNQKHIGTLTPEQEAAIKSAGGIRKIAQTPIGELTKGQKTLGWLSFGLMAWMFYDDYKKSQRAAKRKRKSEKERRQIHNEVMSGISGVVDDTFRTYGLKK